MSVEIIVNNNSIGYWNRRENILKKEHWCLRITLSMVIVVSVSIFAILFVYLFFYAIFYDNFVVYAKW